VGALLDTNVVLDALANREPWAKEAKDLLFLASCGKLDLCLSGSTLTDIFYLANRYVYHDKRRSVQVVDILMESLGVVDVGLEACLMGAHSPIADYEDAVLAEAARTAKVDCIVTRNERDFEGGPVPVMSPHAYLESVVKGYR
jgi:predicted nucleic acid-binding protein